ncbi:hypothetical protein CC80DRAFT_551600 [Byssothecium circinans]|uniref:Uncharacterized protein n=1 Tax=Byssothecium circinans TaxID=147558 RepID=A0A6A5TQZ4_9PLEO|nr:hypothetical protein CC80DRAFT_551600 [Byssothecium circinans]
MPFIRRIRKNPADDEANQKINELNQRLDEFINKHKYLDWKIYPDVALSGQSEPATPTPAKEPATSISAKEPATPTPAKKAKASPKPATEWKPGLTEKGERIIAMAPTETTDVLGNPTITRCLFLVKKKGEKNPIAFEDAADVGEKAARGYLEQLPKTKRIDIRNRCPQKSLNKGEQLKKLGDAMEGKKPGERKKL